MKKELAFVLVFIFLASLVSARLTVSEPNDVYNFGDKLYVTVEGIRGSDTGNLNINLFCHNETVNLLKISARSFSRDGTQSYSIPDGKSLTKEDLEIDSLEDLIGECKVSVMVGTEQVTTKAFKISNEIFVEASTDKLNYDPGEPITLTVDATKANGNLLNGFVEGSNATDFSKEIVDGYTQEVFSLPETSEAGDYTLDIFVYDVSEDRGILNEFKTKVNFKINQIATFVEMALSDLEVTPGKEFTLSADVYDQSGKEMGGVVNLMFVSPKGEEIERTVESGDFTSIIFPLNATAGTWKVYSSFEDLNEEVEFKMLELQKVEFEIQDSILTVRNVGNARYNKNISVDIGGTTETLDLDIEIGGVRKFNLKAPDGEYSVSVGDGEEGIQASVLLTGKAVSIRDLKTVGIFKGYSIVWIFLIVILLGVGAVLFFRYKKRTIKFSDKMKKMPETVNTIKEKVKSRIPQSYSSQVRETLNFTNKSPAAHNLDGDESSHGMIDLTQAKVGKAESSLVLKGEKNPSAVVAVYIENYNSLSNDAKKRLAMIIASVKESKGLVDWKEDHIFVVYSPLATKTFKNELLASRAGFDIANMIKLQNKKYRDKIEFNIGVNAGDLVANKEGGRLKYTSIGNTIALAKRISDSDSGKVLVSDSIRRKLMRDLRAEKVGTIGNSGVYEVEKIVDKAANEEKLKNILKRMEHD